MPDFLTDLAGRTLGVAPIAQPIIAPLFAPKPALLVPASTFLDEEETLESQPPANSLSSSPPLTQHASPIARTAHQPIVSPVQPFSGTTDNITEPSQINSPMYQEEKSINLRDARLVPTSMREPTAPHPTTQDNEPTSPALPATQLMAGIKEHTLTNARDFPAHSREAGAATVSHTSQPESLEKHEHFLIIPAEKHVRATQPAPTVTSSQPVKKPLREVSAESSLSRPGRAMSQFNIQEGVESKDAQGVAHQQQHSSPEVVSRRHIPEASSLPDRVAALPGEQDLLVPHGANRPGKLVEQSIVRQQTSGLTPVYEQDTSSAGGRSLTHAAPEQRSERAEQLHPADSMDVQSVAPTIRVTIGRIDVRAITSPAATTRPKPTGSGPTLSLEDYARQNRGGR